jgi:uncharacterized protein YcfJ
MRIFGLLVGAALAASVSPAALAHDDWDGHRGHYKKHHYVEREVIVVERAPRVIYAPPPRVVYVQPPPRVVYVEPPPPVYVAPPPVYRAPPVAYTNACAGLGRDTIGALVGGVGGGVLGSQVGKGSGRTAATIGGTLGGALIGGSVGRSLDRVEGC